LAQAFDLAVKRPLTQAKLRGQFRTTALNGQNPVAKFKIELICIIDALNHGTLVFRNETREFMLPPSRLFHWAKRWFEGHYLQIYR
jgi:sulfide:quinone oxidoreductase